MSSEFKKLTIKDIINFIEEERELEKERSKDAKGHGQSISMGYLDALSCVEVFIKENLVY